MEAHLVAPALVVATYGNVHLSIYRGKFDSEEFAVASETHLALQARYPGTCMLYVGEPGSAMPGAQVRREAAVAAKAVAAKVENSSLTLEGSGFWSSASRSAFTAIMMLAGNPLTMKVFADVDSSARHIWPQVVDISSVQALVSAVVELRSL